MKEKQSPGYTQLTNQLAMNMSVRRTIKIDNKELWGVCFQKIQ